MSSYNRDIKYIKGVGEKTAGLLKRLGVFSLDALLCYYPRSYKDWSDVKRLGDAAIGETACFRAKITSDIVKHNVKNRMVLYKFFIYDRTGGAAVTIFNNRYLAETLEKGGEYLFYGKIQPPSFGTLPELNSPEIKKSGEDNISPVYRLTDGLYNKTLERIIKNALEYVTDEEFLPEEIIKKYRLCRRKYALYNIHFPTDKEALHAARRRLTFEELFLLRSGQQLLKSRNKISKARPIDRVYFDEFCSSLPFELTAAQQRAFMECINDMRQPHPMNRLLQGDVGCGKTAGAAALVHTAAKNGYKSVLMAPTGILASQHFDTMRRFLPRCRIGLLLGSMKKSEKQAVKDAFKNNQLDLLIGTHAVISEGTELSGAALCITDEQHRFGVVQRAALSSKAGVPHTLFMSATPIPRTLGLIIYGELDISVIDELPKGRQRIESYHIKSALRERAFNYIKKHLDEGRQGYIVCPLVEEGENSLKPAVEYKRQLENGFFKNYRLGLLHGKMKSKEKEAVMDAFLRGDIQLLVATTIVEVGVDVKNAAIMLVEDAERFGLATLHQLRGRIGRGPYKSTFIMISDHDTKRLDVICRSNDGFKIAEEDLLLRGPGDFLGEKQHGLPELKLANLMTDVKIMQVAGEEAAAVLASDPGLDSHPLLLSEIKRLFDNIDIDI